jgi:hypothetical protein
MSITHLRLVRTEGQCPPHWAHQRSNCYLIGRFAFVQGHAAGTGGCHFQVNAPPQKDALALLAKRFERRTYRQGPDRPLSLPAGRLARYSLRSG